MYIDKICRGWRKASVRIVSAVLLCASASYAQLLVSYEEMAKAKLNLSSATGALTNARVASANSFMIGQLATPLSLENIPDAMTIKAISRGDLNPPTMMAATAQASIDVLPSLDVLLTGSRDFLVQRAKQEIAASFMFRVRDWINEAGVNVLFPNAANLMIDDDMLQSQGTVSSIRHAIKKDLRQLPKAIIDSLLKASPDPFKQDVLMASSALWNIQGSVLDNYTFCEVMANTATATSWHSLKVNETRVSLWLYYLSMTIYSARREIESEAYLDPQLLFKTLLVNVSSRRDSVLLNALFQQFHAVIDNARKCSAQIKEFRRAFSKESDPNARTVIVLEMTRGLTQYLNEYVGFGKECFWQVQQDLQWRRFSTTWSQTSILIHCIVAGDYSEFAMETLEFVSNESVNFHLPGKSRQIILFASEMASARDAESVVRVINAFAAPPGAFMAKRRATGFYYKLNGYVGGAGAYVCKDDKIAAGGFIPIGFEFGHRMNTRGWSWGILVQIMDLGTPSFFKMESSDTNPKIGFKQVFSPGVMFLVGVKDSPLAFALGINAVSGLWEKNKVRGRLMLSGLVDIPLYP